MDIQIKQGPQCHPSNCYTYRNDDILFIVIHFTGNNGDMALNNCTFFSGANRKASANYFSGNDGIYQSVPDKWAAWAVGGTKIYKHPYCRNMNSISIEMCSRIGADGKYYIDDVVVEQTIKLTKYLMNKYNVPVENVLRHYDVWNKKCPEPFVRQPELWENFKKRLTGREDLTMEQYNELKQLIQSQQPIIYNYMDENMPSWAKPTIQKLMNKGFIVGDDEGKLGLTMDAIRIFVANDRAGLYD